MKYRRLVTITTLLLVISTALLIHRYFFRPEESVVGSGFCSEVYGNPESLGLVGDKLVGVTEKGEIWSGDDLGFGKNLVIGRQFDSVSAAGDGEVILYSSKQGERISMYSLGGDLLNEFNIRYSRAFGAGLGCIYAMVDGYNLTKVCKSGLLNIKLPKIFNEARRYISALNKLLVISDDVYIVDLHSGAVQSLSVGWVNEVGVSLSPDGKSVGVVLDGKDAAYVTLFEISTLAKMASFKVPRNFGAFVFGSNGIYMYSPLYDRLWIQGFDGVGGGFSQAVGNFELGIYGENRKLIFKYSKDDKYAKFVEGQLLNAPRIANVQNEESCH
ncbi:hypothetical protein [Chitinimonas sp. BJYL2]|uniref:hypothetical protein n=1 Tax=Chitinimonas sp. BJYL2 TaxID=2976696 RepID=UPI0022B4704A|nr:hypothetical protein [Chitinimonas sp. BJYL2]